MRILRWIYGVIRKDMKKNIFFCEQLDVISIEDNIRMNHLRWYKHMLSKPTDMIVTRDKIITINDTRRDSGIPKKDFLKQ